MKEKRWVVFKGEKDPTSIPEIHTLQCGKLCMHCFYGVIGFFYSLGVHPLIILVEWIRWLNGQRKRAPTPEELMDLEARRELARQNVALLKKEEERKAREGSTRKVINTVGGPDLKSFIRQFRVPSEGAENHEESVAMEGVRNSEEKEAKKAKQDPEYVRSIEPIGSGQTFRPGIWQPPT
ncbi:hypothetical protein CerSpe_158460 [Prunus speciosa]